MPKGTAEYVFVSIRYMQLQFINNMYFIFFQIILIINIIGIRYVGT